MPDISTLTWQVLAGAFVLSLLLGALMQRTHFCTMGAISDVVSMGDWGRARQWGLAIGVAMAGFAVLVGSGQIDAGKTIHANSRWFWLSALSGGALFGFGMVLASGCGSKTLVRIGGGSLKSLVVMLVMGLAAFATLKGVTAVVRVATVERVGIDFSTVANLSHLTALGLNLPATATALWLGLGLGGVLILWALARPDSRQGDSLLGGIGIGLIIAAMWWLSGHWGHVQEHPETLQEVFLATNSGRAEALSFVAPMAYTLDWLMFFSDKNKLLTVGVASVAGVIVGAAISALAGRTFRWEGFGGTQDVANHLVGAVLMGVGGVTAMGCTIGQGLSGVSTLSLTSFTALAGIVLGAVAALRYQMWRLK